MNLNTERKIKFWLSTIAKVLVIALVAYKLIPFVFGTNELPEDEAIAAKSEAIKKVEDSIVSVQDNDIEKPSRTPKEASLLKKPDEDSISVYDSIQSSIRNDLEVIENSIGIFIFNESNLDRAIARQLEKTVLQEYQVKSILSAPNKQQLLNGSMKGLGNLESTCIGTVSYTYKETNGKITCELRLDFDTYSTQTGFKVKDRSGSITRYGIGFTNEQAKQVAINKVNAL